MKKVTDASVLPFSALLAARTAVARLRITMPDYDPYDRGFNTAITRALAEIDRVAATLTRSVEVW